MLTNAFVSTSGSLTPDEFWCFYEQVSNFDVRGVLSAKEIVPPGATSDDLFRVAARGRHCGPLFGHLPRGRTPVCLGPTTRAEPSGSPPPNLIHCDAPLMNHKAHVGVSRWSAHMQRHYPATRRRSGCGRSGDVVGVGTQRLVVAPVACMTVSLLTNFQTK